DEGLVRLRPEGRRSGEVRDAPRPEGVACCFCLACAVTDALCRQLPLAQGRNEHDPRMGRATGEPADRLRGALVASVRAAAGERVNGEDGRYAIVRVRLVLIVVSVALLGFAPAPLPRRDRHREDTTDVTGTWEFVLWENGGEREGHNEEAIQAKVTATHYHL